MNRHLFANIGGLFGALVCPPEEGSTAEAAKSSETIRKIFVIRKPLNHYQLVLQNISLSEIQLQT
jgi:hypothetical protein